MCIYVYIYILSSRGLDVHDRSNRTKVRTMCKYPYTSLEGNDLCVTCFDGLGLLGDNASATARVISRR